jgi:hypothetical protein
MAFVAEQVLWTREIRLAAGVERAFALFEPEGERLWAQGWEPEHLYPASGEAREGAVFTTRHPGEGETVWTMTAYEPPCRLAYVRVTPGQRAGRVVVVCEEAGEGQTRAAVTYDLTGLSEAGNAYIRAFDEAHYEHFMHEWEEAINFYLAHGEWLTHA